MNLNLLAPITHDERHDFEPEGSQAFTFTYTSVLCNSQQPNFKRGSFELKEKFFFSLQKEEVSTERYVEEAEVKHNQNQGNSIRGYKKVVL